MQQMCWQNWIKYIFPPLKWKLTHLLWFVRPFSRKNLEINSHSISTKKTFIKFIDNVLLANIKECFDMKVEWSLKGNSNECLNLRLIIFNDFRKMSENAIFTFWLNWMRCIDRSSLVIWQKRLNMGIKSFSMSTQMFNRMFVLMQMGNRVGVLKCIITSYFIIIIVFHWVPSQSIQFNTVHVSIILSTMWSIIDRSIIEYQILFPCLAILCFISFFQIFIFL